MSEAQGIMRTFITFLFAILGMCSVSAYDFTEDGIYYSFIGDKSSAITVSVTYAKYGTGDYAGDVVIPSNVTHLGKTYEVKEIGSYTFYNCPELKSIVLPPTVSEIRYAAFRNCSGLREFTLPPTVIEIDDASFIDTPNITSFIIEDGKYPLVINQYNGVSQGLLQECDIRNLHIGREIEYNISRVTRPPFSNLKNLTKVTLADHIVTLGEKFFYNCSSIKDIVLPTNLTTISSSAFNGCSSLENLLLPVKLTKIGDNAFAGCSGITTLSIPASIKTIGVAAFSECNNLKSLIIEDSSESLNLSTNSLSVDGLEALYLGRDVNYTFTTSNQLKSVVLGNGVTTIPQNFCKDLSNIDYLDLGSSVKTIGSYAFQGVGIDTLTLPASLNTVSSYAFNNCTKLRSIHIVDSNQPLSLFAGQFVYCPIEELYVGRTINYSYSENADTWYKSPFTSHEELKKVTISNYVTKLGNYFLKHSPALKSLIIPASVRSIGKNALSGIDLDSLIFEDSNIPLKTDAIGLNDIKYLYIGRDFQDGYASIVERSDSYNYMEANIKRLDIGPLVSTFPAGIVSGCPDIRTFRVPGNVNSIKETFANSTLDSLIFEPSDIAISIARYDKLNPKSLKTFVCLRDISLDNITEDDLTVDSSIPFYNQLPKECVLSDYRLIEDLLRLPIEQVPNIIYSHIDKRCYPFRVIGTGEIEPVSFDLDLTHSCGLGFINKDRIVNLKSKTGNTYASIDNLDISSSVNSANGYDLCLKNNIQNNTLYVFEKSENISNDNIRTVTMLEDGALMSIVGVSGLANIESLTINGPINGKDIFFINRMSGLKSLNLKDARIIGKEEYREGRTTVSNTIGWKMFEKLSNLEEIQLPTTLSIVENDAFYGLSKIKALFVPSSVYRFGDIYQTCNNSLSSLIFEDGDIEINGGYTYECKVDLSSLDSLNYLYWGRTARAMVSVPTSLKEVEFGSGVTRLNNGEFMNCPLIETVTLPEKLEIIGSCAFSNCPSLHSINIESPTLKFIESYAFADCPSLQLLTLGSNQPPTIYSSTFQNIDYEKCKLIVPNGSIGNYWLDTRWSKFLNISDELIKLDLIPDIVYGANEINLDDFAPSGVTLRYESSNKDVVAIEKSILKIKGTGEVTIATSVDDEPYLLTGQLRTFNILPAELQISAPNITINYGDKLGIIECDIEGFCYQDTEDCMLTKPTISMPTSLSPGTYSLIPYGGSATNYRLKYIPGTLTVVPVKDSISWNCHNLEYKVGDSLLLDAHCSNGDDVTYTVDKPQVAKIVQKPEGFYLHFKSEGSVEVTAKALKRESESVIPPVSFTFLSTPKDIEVESVTLNYDHIEGICGQSYRLVASVFPVQANDEILWYTENPTIVMVDETGLLTFKSAGETMVYAASEENPEIRVGCEVRVHQISTSVESIFTNKTDNEIDRLLPYEVFNINGAIINRKINELNKGVYLIRQQSKVWKILIE